MLEKYKHISFDLDDTLVHTVADYRYWLVSGVVKKIGGEPPSQETVNEFWFESDREETITKKLKVNPRNFWQVFKEIDTPRRRSRFTFVYQDAIDCLWRLNKIGKLISVITGSPPWISKIETRKLKGAPVDFYLATTVHKKLKTKPHPSGMYYVLARLGISAQETVYVGNGEEDALFAKNTGVDFIYLARRQHKIEPKETAVAMIKTLDELQ